MNERQLKNFLEKTLKTSTCWLWIGAKNDDGYGYFGINGKVKPVHIIAYLEWVNEIPKGLEIDHLCRVRNCVNPTHLEAVTRNVTVERIPLSTHCKNGHEYEKEGYYISKFKRNNETKTYRKCKVCSKIWDKRKNLNKSRMS